MSEELNVLGTRLQVCGKQPKSGFFRDGSCKTAEQDFGTHTVCAIVTADFLAFTAEQGNDLGTPRPEFDFPGLKPGDRWCLCASRWKEAFLEGLAPPVVLEATHIRSLKVVSLEELLAHGLLQSSEPSHANEIQH